MIALISILILAIGYVLSWAITVGLVYLICFCFSLEFNLLIATGIWLVLCSLKLLFPSKGGK